MQLVKRWNLYLKTRELGIGYLLLDISECNQRNNSSTGGKSGGSIVETDDVIKEGFSVIVKGIHLDVVQGTIVHGLCQSVVSIVICEGLVA